MIFVNSHELQEAFAGGQVVFSRVGCHLNDSESGGCPQTRGQVDPGTQVGGDQQGGDQEGGDQESGALFS